MKARFVLSAPYLCEPTFGGDRSHTGCWCYWTNGSSATVYPFVASCRCPKGTTWCTSTGRSNVVCIRHCLIAGMAQKMKLSGVPIDVAECPKILSIVVTFSCLCDSEYAVFFQAIPCTTFLVWACFAYPLSRSTDLCEEILYRCSLLVRSP